VRAAAAAAAVALDLAICDLTDPGSLVSPALTRMGGGGGGVAKISGTKGRKAVEQSQKPRGALNRVCLVGLCHTATQDVSPKNVCSAQRQDAAGCCAASASRELLALRERQSFRQTLCPLTNQQATELQQEFCCTHQILRATRILDLTSRPDFLEVPHSRASRLSIRSSKSEPSSQKTRREDQPMRLSVHSVSTFVRRGRAK
jgi:hypothetical protein